jgi:hypothetical protein
MGDFIESAKNFVNSAVSRTGWEAQKQMRVRGKQGEIDGLLEQRQKLLDDLAISAMNLYQQGALTDPQLSRLCASVLELDHDVKTRETQLQDIKNEGYPADQFGPAPMTNYTPPPVNPTPSTPPTGSGTSSQAGPLPVGQQPCPNCGSTIRTNALYCRSCGAKLR